MFLNTTLFDELCHKLSNHEKTCSCFRVPKEIIVWTYDSFGNNLGINIDFTKYLRENCGYCSD